MMIAACSSVDLSPKLSEEVMSIIRRSPLLSTMTPLRMSFIGMKSCEGFPGTGIGFYYTLNDRRIRVNFLYLHRIIWFDIHSPCKFIQLACRSCDRHTTAMVCFWGKASEVESDLIVFFSTPPNI